MEKEIWDILKLSDFIKVPNLSKLRILDIGCGPGNVFFHFYVDFGTTNFTGIEQKSKADIEKDPCKFNTYGCNKLSKCIEEYFDDNDSIDLFFYFIKLIDFKILKHIDKIDKAQFNAIFLDNKIHWNTEVESSTVFTNTNEKFDLIILSKVLHYKTIKDPIGLIKNCLSHLDEGGLIFIKSRKIKKETNKLRKVNEVIFKNWISSLKSFKAIDNKKEFMYFLGIKSS